MQIKNIVAKMKYTTKTGEEKTQWVNCGSLFVKDDGKMSIKFNSYIIPVAFADEKGEVWLNVFDKQAKNPAQPAQDEEVPF